MLHWNIKKPDGLRSHKCRPARSPCARGVCPEASAWELTVALSGGGKAAKVELEEDEDEDEDEDSEVCPAHCSQPPSPCSLRSAVDSVDPAWLDVVVCSGGGRRPRGARNIPSPDPGGHQDDDEEDDEDDQKGKSGGKKRKKARGSKYSLPS
ncbi:hypothetical protein T484DRAFT_1745926 [Baffinella frigidus]|nr:hypothetical protein T484DRAFT_1745926 [Cryptophyta sp. CCMP2293]